MNPEHLLLAQTALPLLGSAIALVFRAFSRKWGEYLAFLCGLLLPLVALFALLEPVSTHSVLEGTIGSWNTEIAIRYRFDGLSWLLDLLSLTVAIAAWVYRGPKSDSFTAVLLIQVSALAATMMTYDLFNLFVCLEVLGVTSYVLISGSKKDGASFAAFSYLMVSATAMVFFLLGTFGLYKLTGSLGYEAIARNLSPAGQGQQLAYIVSLVFVTVPVAVRVAIMPLSLWLSDAHSTAPHPVSAMLSGVLLKVPLFALARLLSLLPKGSEAGLLLAYAGAFSALLGVIAALSQKDAKRLLAYHSISQIGYVTSAWGMAIHVGTETPAGKALMASSVLYAIYHGLFKSLLFLSVGTIVDRAHEYNVYRLRGANRILRSNGERLPTTALCFFVGALSITAIPPFNGFFGKMLLTSGLKGTLAYELLTITGIGTVASFIKLSRIFGKGTETPRTTEPKIPVTANIHCSLLLLASLCVAGGIFGPQAYGMVRSLLGGTGPAPVPYTTANLLKSLYTTCGGIVLFLSVSTKIGKRTLAAIRDLPRSFQDHFLGFAVASATLATWLYLA
jgi:multicomponent Na+:H+ antiporter subunit D